MEPITILGLGALLLLFLENATASENFKQKFGLEFITIMKNYHAVLLQQELNYIKNLYKTLLRDFEPTPSEELQFHTRLETVTAIQEEIGNSITVEAIRKVKNLIQIFISDLAVFPKNDRNIENVLSDYDALEKQVTKEFVLKTYESYHEMYKSLPNEELTANSEYTEIDRTMRRFLKPHKNVTERQNFLEYLLIFKLLDDFFDVPEYKELLRSN